MTAPIAHFGTRLAACMLVAGLSMSGPLAASAQTRGPAAVAPASDADAVAPALVPPAADAPQIEHWEYWRARADAAWARVDETRHRLDEANGDVARMRGRNWPQGDARQELQDAQAAARAAHEAAVHALEVELMEEALAAGADRRWLRRDS